MSPRPSRRRHREIGGRCLPKSRRSLSCARELERAFVGLGHLDRRPIVLADSRRSAVGSAGPCRMPGGVWPGPLGGRAALFRRIALNGIKHAPGPTRPSRRRHWQGSVTWRTSSHISWRGANREDENSYEYLNLIDRPSTTPLHWTTARPLLRKAGSRRPGEAWLLKCQGRSSDSPKGQGRCVMRRHGTRRDELSAGVRQPVPHAR